MFRIPTIVGPVLVLAMIPFLPACGASDRADATYASAQSGAPAPRTQLVRPANTRSVSSRELITKLTDAGLEVKELGEGQIDTDDLSRFPEQPRSTIVLRISDGQGNSEGMMFVEFGSWKAAATVDAKPINGFAVRNWFVRGIVSNHFVDLVRAALAN